MKVGTVQDSGRQKGLGLSQPCPFPLSLSRVPFHRAFSFVPLTNDSSNALPRIMSSV
jgi:hypothetical protein